MDANQLAQGTLSRLFKRASDKLLAHVDDQTIRGIIDGLHSPYTADEKTALFDALRAATTQDEINAAIVKHGFWYALNHWWTWLLAHWDEVEQRIEDERGTIDRVKLREGQAMTEKRFYNALAWNALQSQQTVDAWEALVSLRAAIDTDDQQGADQALTRFFKITHQYEGENFHVHSHWYQHILNYWRVERDTDHLFWMTGRWIREAAQ